MNKLKVPSIFDKEYIDSLVSLNSKYKDSKVVETYGCLPFGIISSSRVGSALPTTSVENLKWYISYSEENGIYFNYIMNNTCHGNISHNELNKLLCEQMHLLIDLGVKNITVSTPYLIQFLHNNYPDINIIASINMCTSSIAQVLQLQDMGVGRIVLDRNINRNFKLLKDIKLNCNVDIELLTNSMCLPFCIMHQYHNNLNSHYQEGVDEELIKCYPYSVCFSSYISNPILMLCSGWIRPEDVKLYTSIGINKFKIDGRGIERNTLLSVIEPYMKNNFEGNLFDLMFSGRATRQSISAYLDNKELEGFLDYISTKSIDCRYCGGKNSKCVNYSKKITFNEEKRKEYLLQNEKDTSNIFEKV